MERTEGGWLQSTNRDPVKVRPDQVTVPVQVPTSATPMLPTWAEFQLPDASVVLGMGPTEPPGDSRVASIDVNGGKPVSRMLTLLKRGVKDLAISLKGERGLHRPSAFRACDPNRSQRD